MTVTANTIATALGRDTFSSVEQDQWEMWISDALLLIENRLGDPAELEQAKLDYVVREAVVQHVRRPDNATQVTVSVNDASTSRTYATGRGRVTILDEWWELLSPTEGGTGRAFEVDTMPADGGVGVLGVDYWWSTPTDIVQL